MFKSTLRNKYTEKMRDRLWECKKWCNKCNNSCRYINRIIKEPVKDGKGKSKKGRMSRLNSQIGQIIKIIIRPTMVLGNSLNLCQGSHRCQDKSTTIIMELNKYLDKNPRRFNKYQQATKVSKFKNNKSTINPWLLIHLLKILMHKA